VNAIPAPSPEEIDAGREREIETARRAMVQCDEAGDKEGAREFKERMYALIGERSQQQRERMEAKLPKPWGTR
jgi:hypothetical protein